MSARDSIIRIIRRKRRRPIFEFRVCLRLTSLNLTPRAFFGQNPGRWHQPWRYKSKNARAGKKSGILRFWGVQKIFFGSKIIFQVCDPGDSCDDSIALPRSKTTLGVVFVACQYDPISWRSSSGDTREFVQSCFWLMSVARETILEFER